MYRSGRFTVLMVAAVLFGLPGLAAEETGVTGVRSTDQSETAEATGEAVRVEKYAIAADGRDVSTSISHQVGRAPYFLILDDRGELIEAIQNPYLELKFGLGPLVADMLAEKKVTVLVGGFAGPNMHQKLKKHGIRFIHGKGGVKRVVNSLHGEAHPGS